jgi:hypothetical protein
MGFTAEYFIHVGGEQKGPFSFPELKRLYDRNLIAGETLYWRDGLDQWQPVSDLCGPSARERQVRKRGSRILLGTIILLALFVAAYLGPMIAIGWRENNQDEFTANAAYWKARGFIRDHLRKAGETVSFSDFEGAAVTMGENVAEAVVAGTIFGEGETSRPAWWRVKLAFHQEQREWRLASPIRSIPADARAEPQK